MENQLNYVIKFILYIKKINFFISRNLFQISNLVYFYEVYIL